MTKKRKAAPPVQAGTLGETASKTTARNCSKTRRFRQRVKGLIVWLGVQGILSYGTVDFLVQRGGFAGD